MMLLSLALRTFLSVSWLLAFRTTLASVSLANSQSTTIGNTIQLTSTRIGFGCYFYYSPIIYPTFTTNSNYFVNAMTGLQSSSIQFLHYVALDISLSTITHIFEVQQSVGGFLEYRYTANIKNYEGKWYMVYINYSKSEKIGNITISDVALLNKQVYNLNGLSLFNVDSIQTLLGGPLLVYSVFPQNLQLVSFKGILYSIQEESIPYIEKDLLKYVSSIKCKCSENYGQTSYQLNGDKYVPFISNRYCNSMGVQGWVQVLNINQRDVIEVIQVSANRFQKYYEQVAGNAFNLAISSKQVGMVDITVTTYSYQFPNENIKITGVDPFQVQKQFLNIPYSIGDWFYLLFTKLETHQTNLVMQFQTTTVSYNFGLMYQFSNLNLNVYLGGNPFKSEVMVGNFESINFSNCYTSSSKLPMCHYSCVTCNGPYETNCLTCSSTNLRSYNPILKSCPCGIGYYDYSQAKCKSFNALLSISYIPTGYTNDVCGVWSFKVGNLCYKCPSLKTDSTITCADCLINPNTWINNPICKYEYQLINNVYKYQLTDTQLIFVLDNNNILTLCVNCKLLCSSTDSTCPLSNYFHMGVQQLVQCILGYQIIDGFCKYVGSSQITSTSLICGFNCASCSNTRCYYCMDQYFLSTDGWNCEYCVIQNCRLCYIYDENDSQYQTLNWNMKILNRQTITLRVGCAICSSMYSYNFQTNQCEIMTQISSTCLQQYKNNDGKTICLISSKLDFSEALIIKSMDSFYPNCNLFLNINMSGQIKCLGCSAMNVLLRGTNTCKLPQDARFAAFQYDSALNDYINNEAQPFFYTHYPTQELFGIVVGQILYQSINCKDNQLSMSVSCLSNCLPGCKKCIDYGICVDCGKDQYGVLQRSLINDNCLACPYMCALCIQRDQAQITKINPYYLSTLPTQFTNRCLLLDSYFQDQNGIIDDYYHTPILCNMKVPCKIVANYYLNYTCAQITSALLSKSSFWITIENTVDASYLNFRQVQIVNYFFKLNITSSCAVGFLSITNTLRNSVFLLQEVNIEFFGVDQNVPLLMNQWNIFQFTSVKFTNITIQSMPAISVFGIGIISTDQVNFYMENVNILGTINLTNSLNVTILNAQNISLKNVNITNIIIRDQFLQAILNNTALNKLQFTITQLQLTNTSIKQTTLFQITNYINAYLDFAQLNFSTIYLQNGQLLKLLNLTNLVARISDLNVEYSQLIMSQLFYLKLNEVMQIENLTIKYCTLQSSSIVLALNQFQLKNTIIHNNSIDGCILTNQLHNISDSNGIMLIENITIQDNTYTNAYSFLQLVQNSENNNNLIIIIQSTIINNSYQFTMNDTTMVNFKANIQCQSYKVIMRAVFIIKSRGYSDIQVNSAKVIDLQEFSVQSQTSQKLDKIHQFGTCIDTSDQYYSLLLVQDSFNLSISNFIFSNIILFNSPLISYTSNTYQQQSDVTVNIKNCQFTNIVLIKTLPNIQLASILIYSYSPISIIMIKLTFKGIWLNEYLQDSLAESGNSISIKSVSSDVYLNDIVITNVISSNTTDSAIFIDAQQITITSLKALNINQFNKDNIYIFQTFIHWSFLTTQQVYLENIQAMFRVSSYGGLFKLSSENIMLKKLSVTNCQGLLGGVMYIKPKLFGNIDISNSDFSASYANVNSPVSSGGLLYIDAYDANLNLTLTNLTVQDSFCSYQGGSIYIKPSKLLNNCKFNNIYVIDSFSRYGSFLYYETALSLVNIIDLYNIVISTTNITIFLEQFNRFDSIQDTILDSNYFLDIDQGYLIQFNISTLLLENCTFYNIGTISVLKATEFYSFTIRNSLINQFIISKSPLIYLNKKQLADNHEYLIINQLQILNGIDITQLPNIQLCEDLTILPMTVQGCQDIRLGVINLELQYSSDQLTTIAQCRYNYIIQKLGALDSLFLIKLGTTQSLESSSRILQTQTTQDNMLNTIDQLMISQINCTKCINGLVTFIMEQSNIQKVQIQDSRISGNQCGNRGCLSILSGNKYQNQQPNGINLTNDLNTTLLNKSLSEFYFIHTQFTNNLAIYGGGLFVEEVAINFVKCLFSKNQADFGGAALLNALVNQTIDLQVVDNQAKFGGGIFLLGINNLSQTTQISNNKATIYSNNIVQTPTSLCLVVNGVIIFPTLTVDNENIVSVNPFYILGQKDAVQKIMVPSGQKLKDYQYFNINDQTYINYNLSLRVVALNNQQEQVGNLEGTQCQLDLRVISDSNIQLKSDIIPYFSETFDYNLDNYTFIHDPYSEDSIFEISVNCNSIRDDAYSIKFQANTFKCQLGEYYYQYQCLLCDASQNYYSLDSQTGKCEIKDDSSTISITQSMVQLKVGYWRYKVTSSRILPCLNNEDICKGGWTPGDDSCMVGHIGALCEECDIANTRGNGKYGTENKYVCYECKDLSQLIFKLIGLTIWQYLQLKNRNILSVYLTISGQLVMESNVRKLKLTTIHYKVLMHFNISKQFVQLDTQAIIIKMFTNFIQIIVAIRTFNLILFKNLNADFTLSSISNPVGQVSQSLDCISTDMIEWNVLYTSFVFTIVSPMLMFLICILLYLVYLAKTKTKYQTLVVSTLSIFIYLLTQQGIVDKSTSIMASRNIADQKWVTGNVSLKYLSGDHTIWLFTIVTPVVLFHSIVIPCGIFYFVRRKVASHYQTKTRNLVSYLINEYRDTTYFWELIKVTQRALIIAILNFTTEYTFAKGGYILFVLYIYLGLVNKLKPYTSMAFNALESKSQIICTLCIITALLSYQSQSQNNVFYQYLYNFVLILLITIQVTHFLWLLFQDIFVKVVSSLNTKIIEISIRFPSLKKIFNFLIRSNQRKKIMQDRFEQLRAHLRQQSRSIISMKERAGSGSYRDYNFQSTRNQFKTIPTSPKTDFILEN